MNKAERKAERAAHIYAEWVRCVRDWLADEVRMWPVGELDELVPLMTALPKSGAARLKAIRSALDGLSGRAINEPGRAALLQFVERHQIEPGQLVSVRRLPTMVELHKLFCAVQSRH